jgi:hypothetical protein
MASEIKKKTVRKIVAEGVESAPKSGRQPGKRVKKSSNKKKTPFEKTKKDVEKIVIDLVRPNDEENPIPSKDATCIQILIGGVHLIAETYDFYKKNGNWKYVDVVANLNNTCWLILEKQEEE